MQLAHLVIALSCFAPLASQASETWGPFRAEYVKNYDGDSLTADLDIYPGLTMRERLRVASIDTPEIGGCDPEKALKAKEFTRVFVQDGFTVIIRGRGSFGRPLADIDSGGQDLGEALIDEGLARPYSERWC